MVVLSDSMGVYPVRALMFRVLLVRCDCRVSIRWVKRWESGERRDSAWEGRGEEGGGSGFGDLDEESGGRSLRREVDEKAFFATVCVGRGLGMLPLVNIVGWDTVVLLVN